MYQHSASLCPVLNALRCSFGKNVKRQWPANLSSGKHSDRGGETRKQQKKKTCFTQALLYTEESHWLGAPVDKKQLQEQRGTCPEHKREGPTATVTSRQRKTAPKVFLPVYTVFYAYGSENNDVTDNYYYLLCID